MNYLHTKSHIRNSFRTVENFEVISEGLLMEIMRRSGSLSWVIIGMYFFLASSNVRVQ